MRAPAPIYGLAFLIGAALYARLELGILTGHPLAGVAPSAARSTCAADRIDVAQARRRIDFNETPATINQLGITQPARKRAGTFRSRPFNRRTNVDLPVERPVEPSA